MEPKLPAPLTDFLEYLDGIGYGDLYVSAPAPTRGAAGLRSMTKTAVEVPGRRGALPPQRPPGAGQPTAVSRSAESSSVESPSAAPSPAAPRSNTRRSGPVEGSSKGSRTPPSPTSAPLEPLLSGPPPEDVGGRIQELAKIARKAAGCQACGLCRGRHLVVFGQGHPDADLMLIGEGPGAQEDRQGLPFVGPAGELLNKIIQAIGETRQGVYIANVVKCRPPNNRDPLPDEVAACRAYLEAQIDLIRPKVVVALGRVAAQSLLGSTLALGKLRGSWHEVRGVPTRATYHPAALLRNSSWKRPTWEDMQLVRDHLRDLRGQ